MTDDKEEQETIFDGSAESGSNQGQNNSGKALPPIASNGNGVNLWVDEDKNGDCYLRIDAPFLETVNVFFNDDVKDEVNEMVEGWRQDRGS